MEVQLTADQQAIVRTAVESGRYKCEEDALRDALSLWENREGRRAEILAAVVQAEASFARGEGRLVSTQEESDQSADEIIARGRTRLAAEKASRMTAIDQ